MINVFPNLDRAIRVLFIGAHSDDIEIGCGGTIRRLIASGRDVAVYWFVASGTTERHEEARNAASHFLDGCGTSTIDLATFTDGHFPFEAQEIKSVFATRLRDFGPDVVFTHYRDDRHQDHRTLSDLTWQTFRNHLVLEYEVPKYDGDLGQPNLFVKLSADDVAFKVQGLERSFASQRNKHWFSEDTFRALLRLRGMESASESGWAEAFYSRKAVLGFM